MITIDNTENLTGVIISGDLNDFQALVEAFYAVSIDEEDSSNSKYVDNSRRVLGLCYDIRHAFMGDRGIALVNNGMNRELMSLHSQITPEQTVYFKVNCLYPEMIFVTAATFTRWLNAINARYSHVLFMSGHYLDYINLEYLKLDKEKRQKKLSSVSKSIIEYTYDPIHEKMRHEAKVMAEQYGCSPSDLVNPVLEYPEEIEW